MVSLCVASPKEGEASAAVMLACAFLYQRFADVNAALVLMCLIDLSGLKVILTKVIFGKLLI
jgi:hypothetical protein